MNKFIPVMLVDNTELVQQAKIAFVGSRFEVHAYVTAETALQNLNSSRFEVAVIDLRMMGPDGRPLIEHVVSALPRIRCVALVERPDIASVQQAMKLGCRSYLAKPTTPQAVLDAIKEVAQTSGLLSISERELQLRLSRLLRAKRLRQEVTLTEMANRIGLSKAQLSQIELGKSWPSFPTLKRISEELDEPFSELFKTIEQDVPA